MRIKRPVCSQDFPDSGTLKISNRKKGGWLVKTIEKYKNKTKKN